MSTAPRTIRSRSVNAICTAIIGCAALVGGRGAAQERSAEAPPVAEQPPSAPVSIFADAVAAAQQRTAKIYGAAVGRDKGYGTGVVVSADGKILTALTALLEGSRLRAVLGDGRRADARVIARDEVRQLALLQVDLARTPFFEFAPSGDVRAGDWVIAATNCFKIAEGDEPVTTTVGVISGRAPLQARRRTRDVSYEGAVFFTDVVVSSPGSAGGALVDLRGRLVGLIGRPVVSNFTNTWANYAVPADDLAAFLAAPDSGASRSAERTTGPEAAAPGGDGAADSTQRAARPDLGIQLFSIGGRTKPAYVERVRKDSPAAQAGLRANDLILSVNGKPVATCEQYEALILTLRPGETAELAIKRGEAISTLKLTVGSKP